MKIVFGNIGKFHENCFWKNLLRKFGKIRENQENLLRKLGKTFEKLEKSFWGNKNLKDTAKILENEIIANLAPKI